MEKLQSAIEKARKTRLGDGKAEHVGRLASSSHTRAVPASGDLWQQVPHYQLSPEHLNKHRIVSSTANIAATPFDILRTKVLMLMRQNNWNRLAITSPSPGCGKTTVACNLALGLARQSDLRSILFDLDFRKPHAAKAFGLTPPHCVSELLTEPDIGLSEQGMRIGSNLILCLAQKSVSDPTSILLDNRTKTKLNDIQNTYKPALMVFDLPPVLVSDDVRAFLSLVDCALIVTRANQTRYGHFDKTENEIASHTNVLGVVLNGSSNLSGDYEDYTGY